MKTLLVLLALTLGALAQRPGATPAAAATVAQPITEAPVQADKLVYAFTAVAG